MLMESAGFAVEIIAHAESQAAARTHRMLARPSSFDFTPVTLEITINYWLTP